MLFAYAGHFLMATIFGCAKLHKVATMSSCKGKRARIVCDDEEEALEVEEDGPLTMSDLPFDIVAVRDDICKKVFNAALLLH